MGIAARSCACWACMHPRRAREGPGARHSRVRHADIERAPRRKPLAPGRPAHEPNAVRGTGARNHWCSVRTLSGLNQPSMRCGARGTRAIYWVGVPVRRGPYVSAGRFGVWLTIGRARSACGPRIARAGRTGRFGVWPTLGARAYRRRAYTVLGAQHEERAAAWVGYRCLVAGWACARWEKVRSMAGPMERAPAGLAGRDAGPGSTWAGVQSARRTRCMVDPVGCTQPVARHDATA